jgi:hypothetical protein
MAASRATMPPEYHASVGTSTREESMSDEIETRQIGFYVKEAIDASSAWAMLQSQQTQLFEQAIQERDDLRAKLEHEQRKTAEAHRKG